ncbi:MAG: TlpA family protein disulfide reductase [Saprospiraceae bacterium]|jgi:thiol-disulfide isomerase/thioredoxin|nr:TlpA family protein disulfide reductase [Saprospiraceae bacterium]
MKLITFISVVFLLFTISCNNAPDKKENNPANDQITNIKTPDVITAFDQLDEKYFHLKDTLLVVNFWATWCKPCVQELPYFNDVAKKYSSQKVKFLFISLDFLNTIDKSLKPFIQQNPFNGDVVLLADQDVNNWAINIDKNWDGAIPVTMLIKNDKKSAHLGSFKNSDELNSFIQSNL